MAREHLTIRAQHAVVYDGAGELTCDARDLPHAWEVGLRCSQEELDLFLGLRSGRLVQVDVRQAGVGRAVVAGVEGAQIRLTGVGLCPYPDH